MSEPATPESLKLCAEQLSRLPFRDDAEVVYDLLSGAAIWLDEKPASSDHLFDSDFWYAMRAVWHFRTASILGEDAKNCELYWTTAKRLFPTWPGFAPQRCSVALRDIIWKLREESRKQLDADLDDLIDP